MIVNFISKYCLTELFGVNSGPWVLKVIQHLFTRQTSIQAVYMFIWFIYNVNDRAKTLIVCLLSSCGSVMFVSHSRSNEDKLHSVQKTMHQKYHYYCPWAYKWIYIWTPRQHTQGHPAVTQTVSCLGTCFFCMIVCSLGHGVGGPYAL